MNEYKKHWGVTKIKSMKLSYKWTIYNFSICGKKTAEMIKSPSFSSPICTDYQWHLELYPKGYKAQYENYLSIFLYIKGANPNIETKLTFGIIDRNNKEIIKCECLYHYVSETGCGSYTFVKRTDLFDVTKNMLDRDKLVIICNITAGIGNESFVGENVTELSACVYTAKICNDLYTLVEKQELTDVVLVANGKELHAHKTVLGARSPVFLAIFNTDMREKKECRVEISDFDSDVLTEMLRYIYTGQVQNIEQYSHRLLIAADKYALEGLKHICEKFLCNKISINNAIESLTLADQYNCNKLKVQVINFIIAHGKDIIDSPEFKTLKNSHPHVMIDVFQEYVSR